MPDPGPLTTGDPEQVGGYRLTGVLGEGGQGVVYLAHAPHGRRVAVKMLHARMAADPMVRERFLREAEVGRRVAAFCTARVLDAGVAGDRLYMVSEYIPGPSLHDLVADDGPRAGSGLDRLAVTTLTALAAIHQAGIIHRDFKPRNVIMGPEGPVVIDFGIARAMERTATTSELVGSPAYLAPELLDGREAGPASDVFSWAATMVYAATGHPAFPGNIQAAVMNAILTREPDLSGVPAHLRPLLAACLDKDPGARPTVTGMLATLTGRGSPVRDEPLTGPGARPGNGPAGPRSVVRRVRSAAVAVSAAVLLLVAAFWLRGPDVPGKPAPPSAQPSAGASSSEGAGPAGLSLAHSDSVWTVATARLRDRPVLVSGDGSTMRVWDLTTGEPVGAPITGHVDGVSSVAVARLGERPVVVSGSDDRTVRVWDLATGDQLGAPFTGHTGWVESVAVTELNGHPVVVSGGYKGSVLAWDLVTRKPVGTPIDHPAGVESVAVTELDGRQVIVAGSRDHTVRVWDLLTGEPVGAPLAGHTHEVHTVAVTELDGRPVVVSGSRDHTVRVWDPATGEPVGAPFTGHSRDVMTVTAAQVGGRPVVVSGGHDRSIRIWDPVTGEPLGAPFTGHTGGVVSLLVTERGGRPVLVSGGQDKTLKVWDL
ncbi:protein kinase [Planomonospora sp. ID67723]|uniref:WD40 repeat domain-containing serine/threonine protein kinase n=1 Tax=Planomonospora sp. ID67723 TaxID=2738134 RepID=UPI0018C44B3A|nr:serine/threonine-protein kinase [Planomonospora sp. ID67723]MBG0827210.1 protein kinase [Planomonospora sp. ID67723]